MALFVDLVALSNGLHGSVQMDLVALFSWIGWLRHHGIFIDLCFSSFFYIIYKILNMESKDYVKNRYFKDNDRIYILLGVN